MSTAEDIIRNRVDIPDIIDKYDYKILLSFRFIEELMNEAMREIIKECSEIATVKRFEQNPFVDTTSALYNSQRDQVDKQSILNLLTLVK